MTIRVLLFAAAKESVGQDSVTVDLDGGSNVADLRKQLATEYPVLAELVSRSFIAVDQQFAADEMPIVDAKEIALIPPVSGG
jgi:molybdopterin converting factor subunit 1